MDIYWFCSDEITKKKGFYPSKWHLSVLTVRLFRYPPGLFLLPSIGGKVKWCTLWGCKEVDFTMVGVKTERVCYHVICKSWHVIPDTLLVVNIVSKLQVLTLTVWGLLCFEDVEEKDNWINDWMTGVCRTSPATPGLLNMLRTTNQATTVATGSATPLKEVRIMTLPI